MQVFYFGVVDKKTNRVSTEMSSTNEEAVILGLRELLARFYPGETYAVFTGIYRLERGESWPLREIWSRAGEIVKKAGFSGQHTIYRLSPDNLERFFPAAGGKMRSAVAA